MVVCDGLKGLPDAVDDRLAADDRADLRGAPAAQLLPLRRPPGLGRDRQGAQARLHRPDRGRRDWSGSLEFAEAWGEQVPGDRPAVGERLGRVRAVPGLRRRDPQGHLHAPTRSSSVNARIRRAVKARGHFPNEQAALKCVYMAMMSLDPTGKGRKRWTMRWKPALNAFEITFDGRLTPANH